MVALGMGVKVATLPVIALGVGIGVDYALYILSVMLGAMVLLPALAHFLLKPLVLHDAVPNLQRAEAAR